MSSTDEDKICFSGSERIKKLDLVLLAREEESKVIDAVRKTEESSVVLCAVTKHGGIGFISGLITKSTFTTPHA